MKPLAPVRQWLTNHPRGEGVQVDLLSGYLLCADSEWLSFPVLRKPMSFHLLSEICASELGCCYSGFNDLDLLSPRGTVSGRISEGDRLNTFIKTHSCWKYWGASINNSLLEFMHKKYEMNVVFQEKTFYNIDSTFTATLCQVRDCKQVSRR